MLVRPFKMLGKHNTVEGKKQDEKGARAAAFLLP
jgi:hypothetical protein